MGRPKIFGPRKIYKGLSDAERDEVKRQAWDEASGGRMTLEDAKQAKSRESKQMLKAYKKQKSLVAEEKRQELRDLEEARRQQAEDDAAREAFADEQGAVPAGVAPCPENPPDQPCYLEKLIIKSEWPPKPAAPPEPPGEDPATLDEKARLLQKEIEENQHDLDEVMGSGTSYIDEAELKRLKAKREKLEDDLFDLMQERACSGNPPKPLWKPPVNPREFTIVEDPPNPHQVDQPLEQPRAELTALSQQWHEIHDAHEAAKTTLADYSKKKDKLEKAKNAARLKLEQAKRELLKKEQELREGMEADLDRAQAKRAQAQAAFQGAMGTLTESSRRKKLESAVDDVAEAERKLRKFEARQTERLKKKDRAHEDAELAFEKARDAYRDYATGREYTDAKNEEERRRAELRTKTDETDAKVDEINGIEQSILAQKNTLRSGSVIELTAGSEEKYISWLSDDDGSLIDETPEIEVRLEGGAACSDDPPKSYQLRSGLHRHIVATEQTGESDVISKARAAKLPKFKVFQVRVWDDKLGQARIPGVRLLQQAAQFFRAVARVFGSTPSTRLYRIRAGACGVETVQPFKTGTDSLQAILKVYPADKYAVSITTPPAFGQAYTREMQVAKADAPVAETGQLQYESSGSQIEISDKETHTTSRWGVTQTMTSTEHIRGYDLSSGGTQDKDIVVTQTAQREGGVFGTMRTTTDASGTHHGEAYTGRLVTTNTYNMTGSAPTQVVELSEQGMVADRHDAQGNLLSIDDYREQSEQSGNVSTMQPGDTLKRVPALPGSFFPQIPIDISFTRNDREDEFTQNIKSAVGTVIWLTRQLGVYIGRVGNVMPAVGWKFGYCVNFLSGKLMYQRQYRDHWDRRVWLHQKGEIDIEIVTAKIFVFAGISVSFVILEFELGIEVHIKGSIGIQGSVENRHPDLIGANVGFGPTGSIGCGAEVRLVIGQADWCKASGDISTSIRVGATWWVSHEDGPHAEAKIGFEGVKATLVFHLVLVGHWEKEHKLCEKRELWSGRFPKEFDADRLNAQTDAMEKERAAAAKEALALEKEIARRKAKQRRSARSTR